MTLQEFIQQYDRENAVVLLEGKREVLQADVEKLVALGKLLATRTRQIVFRSGNAKGADQYFAEGIVAIDRSRLQVIVPYEGHRKKRNQAYETISLDQINLAAEPEVVYHSKRHKKTEKLIDHFIAGNKDRHAIKAAYIIRDTVKSIGSNEVSPASFGIFYDDLNNPRSGGTGHTMRVCVENNIPIIDQTVWFGWLEE